MWHGTLSASLLYYYFQRTQTVEVPASAEIPYDAVRAAVKEFLTTGGERPTNVEWIEG